MKAVWLSGGRSFPPSAASLDPKRRKAVARLPARSSFAKILKPPGNHLAVSEAAARAFAEFHEALVGETHNDAPAIDKEFSVYQRVSLCRVAMPFHKMRKPDLIGLICESRRHSKRADEIAHRPLVWNSGCGGHGDFLSSGLLGRRANHRFRLQVEMSTGRPPRQLPRTNGVPVREGPSPMPRGRTKYSSIG